MKQIFTEDKLELAKKMIVYNFKRNKFSSIFELLKDDIKRLVDLGLPYKMILMYINDELDSDIKYDTFLKWIQKNIKQKNQSSNILKRDTKKQKEKIEKEEVKKIKRDNENLKNKDEEVDDENWKSVIFPQIEEACDGMKKANLRI